MVEYKYREVVFNWRAFFLQCRLHCHVVHLLQLKVSSFVVSCHGDLSCIGRTRCQTILFDSPHKTCCPLCHISKLVDVGDDDGMLVNCNIIISSLIALVYRWMERVCLYVMCRPSFLQTIFFIEIAPRSVGVLSITRELFLLDFIFLIS